MFLNLWRLYLFLTFACNRLIPIAGFRFNIKEVGSLFVDSVSLYSGVRSRGFSNIVDSTEGMETYHIQDILAANNTSIQTARQTYSSYTAFDGVQPDVPRNVIVVDPATTADTGTINISGIDWKGQYVTDAIAIVPNGTAYGVVAFMKVLLADGYDAGAGNTVSLGIGEKLGMPKRMLQDDLISPVLKIKNKTLDVVPTPANVNRVYNTIDPGTITDGDDFTFWYLH